MARTTIIFSLLLLHFTSIAQENLKPIDPEMKNVEYPFPVNYLQLTVQKQNLQMAYMDVWPSKANGKTILLLHGKNFNGAYWQTTATALSQQGYRVIIPDQVGFGKSSKPEHLQYSFQLLAQQTRILLDTLKVARTTVLGHSMGGMLATRFALMYPAIAEKLILENPIGLEDWKLKVPYQSVDQSYQTELRQNYDAIKKYQLENYYGGNWNTAYEQWVLMLAGWTIHPEYPKIAWTAALTSDMVITQPVLYEFAFLKLPTLLIIGQRDRTAIGKNLVPESTGKTMGNYPALGKETAKKIRGSKLVELDNIGHLPHIEAFDRFIKPVSEFLSK